MHPLPGPDDRRRLRPLRRPDASVQIGLGSRSIRLLGLTDAECRWLATVDPARSLTDTVALATLEGIDPTRATEVLDRLVAGGLLHPSASAPPHVAVVGAGALPGLLVDGLRQSERVQVHRVRPGGEDETAVDLAVCVGPAPPTAETIRPWLRAGVPVVPVWCLSEQASIGPLLRPGAGPCLHCLDLTRAEVDPGWPWLTAQLTPTGIGSLETVDATPALRFLAAGLTTSLVLDHVGGRLGTPEWSFEIGVPGPTLERHRWPVHPGCGDCSPEPETPVTLVPTPDDDASDPIPRWRETMAG